MNKQSSPIKEEESAKGRRDAAKEKMERRVRKAMIPSHDEAKAKQKVVNEESANETNRELTKSRQVLGKPSEAGVTVDRHES